MAVINNIDCFLSVLVEEGYTLPSDKTYYMKWGKMNEGNKTAKNKHTEGNL